MPNQNDPAFPQTIDDSGTLKSVTTGLTKRELIAAMAMQAIALEAAKADCSTKRDQFINIACDSVDAESSLTWAAEWCCEMADALLAALAEPPPC